ncbi:MAG: hypothetical protein GY948_22525 [Alphaproteobacteria bacterium]|nr:hypothetical protein [Alphaproteobacteria bacterium]
MSCLVLSAGAQSASAQTAQVQTQAELQTRIAAHKPATHRFVKDKPLVGWVLKSSRFEDIPQAIREHLGDVDKTKYTQDYLEENQGTIIALQMDDDKPDFYIIKKVAFDADYSEVEVAAALGRNPALIDWMKTEPELAKILKTGPDAIVGARKSVQVEMLKLSALGYALERPVTIQSPWGEQSKPAGEEAYLAPDRASGQYYLINQGDKGHPLSYVPVR